MKKFTRWALALGLCLALTVCGALAAENPIHVQLDGKELTFTDAVPQVKDQRTFLPFRAVFESMGAEVDYEGNVITAVRGDKTLTMTLDQTTATVTEQGVTTPITMDVAPYVDQTTWRTYVPVRFAAQAFGCTVGWDQEAQTAIIIDSETLLDKALEGKSFTYLEKLTAMEAKYNQGIWDVNATFDADVSVMGMPMDITGTMDGTIQDAAKMAMDMNMKMDMSKLVAMAAAMGGSLDAEDQAMLDALKTEGVDLTMRGDMMTQGKLYMNMDMGALAAQAAQSGIDANTWYEMDTNKLMEQSGVAGMDWATLMEQAKDPDYADLAKALLSSVEPDNAAEDYAQIKGMVDALTTALSDEAFAEVDGKRVATYTFAVDGASTTATMTLDMDGENVKDYAMSFAMTIPAEEGQNVEMAMDIALDAQDNMKAKIGMDMGGMLSMDMNMDATYTPGTVAPVTTPPEGAAVVDYMELMAAQDDADLDD